MDCIPRVAGKRCGTSQARASMLASGGQPTEVFHSLSRSSHHRDPARQAVQEWGRGSEQGFRASTFAAPRDEHVPPAGLGCRRRCVGRQWKPRPRKLWQTSCRAQVGIPMAPPGLPPGRWTMAGATGRRRGASRSIQTCATNFQTSMRAANFQTLYTVTSRPRRALPTSRPNYYLSHRARECDDADDARRQLPDHDVRRQCPDLIYQTLYTIYHARPAGMTTPTTEGTHAGWYCL